MIDNSKARGLQEIYKARGNGALNALAVECEGIAFIIVKAQCRKYGLRFEREKVLEFAHDAAAQFISQYLKHADYNVRSFSARIRRDVLNVMFGRKRNKQNAFEDGLVQILSPYSRTQIIDGQMLQQHMNSSTALDELIADHPQGMKIAADLARSKSYSQAIRRIAIYVGREWIYEHAEKMHHVWKTFRWKPETKGGIRRTGVRRLCPGLLCSEPAELQQPDQRSNKIPQRRNRKGGGA
jgi:hypothetical protein